MTKQEIRDEIKSILKDYHYDSDTDQMSKDVVTALENLVGYLKDDNKK
jgi:galactitol-specific phosphotransferase system IIB component